MRSLEEANYRSFEKNLGIIFYSWKIWGAMAPHLSGSALIIIYKIIYVHNESKDQEKIAFKAKAGDQPHNEVKRKYVKQ